MAKLKALIKPDEAFDPQKTFKAIWDTAYRGGSRKKEDVIKRLKLYQRQLDRELKKKYALATVKNCYAMIRKLARQKFKEQWVHSIFDEYYKLSEKEYTELNSGYKKQVFGRNADKPVMINVNALLARSYALLADDSYLSKLAGLCLLTGRRPTELIRIAGIYSKEDIDVGRSPYLRATARPNVALFYGQLKGKNREVRAYKIPLLIDYNTVNRVLAEIFIAAPKTLYGKTNAQMHSSMRIGRNMKEIMGEGITSYIKSKEPPKKGICPQTMRAFYNAICIYLYKPPTVHEDIFASHILGHLDVSEENIEEEKLTQNDQDSRYDTATAKSYNIFCIEEGTNVAVMKDRSLYHYLTA